MGYKLAIPVKRNAKKRIFTRAQRLAVFTRKDGYSTDFNCLHNFTAIIATMA